MNIYNRKVRAHCAISYQDCLENANISGTIYCAKLHWFCNYSSEDFRTPEAQVWMGVKIPRPRYLDPHPVFLTHCAISYQDRWKKANIEGTLILLNYFGFAIAQLRILRLQKHKSGWGSRYPGHGILIPNLYSWHMVRLVTKTVWKMQISKEQLLC